MKGLRWSLIIVMEEVGCWSTYEMPMPMENPRWSFTITMHLVEAYELFDTVIYLRVCVFILYIQEYVHLSFRVVESSVASNGTSKSNTAQVHIQCLYILFDHCQMRSIFKV